ncbi:MAG: PH domain-containing protein [Gammaproteobacteria bacterium]|jgi:hypothetical protein|nr:PH domain-containing protein [Gammaproteobacteria bacterium]
MGLMSAITGNASEISAEAIEDEVGPILASGEQITKAYKLIRDYFVFTNSRVILVDKQGITGTQIEFLSIPYRSITSFSIETAGLGFNDSVLTLHIHGMDDIRREFKKSINIAEVQMALAEQLNRS